MQDRDDLEYKNELIYNHADIFSETETKDVNELKALLSLIYEAWYLSWLLYMNKNK